MNLKDKYHKQKIYLEKLQIIAEKIISIQMLLNIIYLINKISFDKF